MSQSSSSPHLSARRCGITHFSALSSRIESLSLFVHIQPLTAMIAMSVSSLVSGSPGRIHRAPSPTDQLRRGVSSHVSTRVVVATAKRKRRAPLLLGPRAKAVDDYGRVPRHNVAIGGHNPTGGDASMDEARVVDPYGCVGGWVAVVAYLYTRPSQTSRSSFHSPTHPIPQQVISSAPIHFFLLFILTVRPCSQTVRYKR